MAGLVDLERLKAWARHSDHDAEGCEHGDQMLLKMAAELRAAREVVEAAREQQQHPGWFLRVGMALAAYDQAVGQPATADQPPGEVR